jgi:hypothetical protein
LPPIIPPDDPEDEGDELYPDDGTMLGGKIETNEIT